MRFAGLHPGIVGLSAVAAGLVLFVLYYLRRRQTNTRAKDDAARVFTDLAQRLGGRYERVDQSPGSVYAYADLGRIAGRTPTSTYEVGCYPRGFEDVGGRLHCTVRAGFDVPATTARWSRRTGKKPDSVRAMFGHRYAEQIRGDLHPALVTLAAMCFEVQINPEYVQAYATPDVFDWPAHPDPEAAAEWVAALLRLVDAFPRRRP